MCLQRQIGCVMPIESSTIVFTPTTMAKMESTLSAFENELTQSSDCFSDEDSCDEWQQQSGRHFTNIGQANTTRRLPGPKSSVRTEDMTPEEIRRRDRRRERNKLAAARCRQRRLDITNQLLAVSNLHLSLCYEVENNVTLSVHNVNVILLVYCWSESRSGWFLKVVHTSAIQLRYNCNTRTFLVLQLYCTSADHCNTMLQYKFSGDVKMSGS